MKSPPFDAATTGSATPFSAAIPAGPDSAAAGPVLQAVAVSKRFGGTLAVDEVSLAVQAGTIAGLIGPNGAGKTTLFDILAGAQQPTSGRVYLRGQALDSQPVHARVAAGLGRTFQIPRPFAGMTVVENVMLGCQRHVGERIWPNWLSPKRVARTETQVLGRAMEWLEFMTLAPLANQPARVLSGGQRKLLELARLLMAEPSVVLLDEPAAGVNPVLLDTIIARIAALNQRGITFLIVEHNMELVAELCRQVFVMAAGKMLCQGPPRDVVRDPRVIDAYLGGLAA
jgi:branched-chain amino acid transport system ATP-binding protein